MRTAVLNMEDDRPTWALPSWAADEIRAELGPGWQLVHIREAVDGRADGDAAPSPDTLDAVRGAEILFALGLPRPLLLAALEQPRALRWIHSGSAGVRSLLHPELVASDVILTNSAGIHAIPMAEAVLGMMLHFARGFDHAVRAQHRREWARGVFEQDAGAVRELADATVGILGYGGIGREVAWRARALGMYVLALRRHRERGADDVELAASLDALLERSDFLVITVPSTAETRRLIGARELARLPQGAVVINVARGDVLDEAALLDALHSGHLRGAALDVFTKEPLPHDSPLWNADRLLITPHVSATTQHFWRREVDLIVDNIARYLNGDRPLRSEVDKRAGY